MIKLLRSWNVVGIVITLLVFSLLIKLGLWQLARADEKEMRLTRITELSAQQSIPLDELLVSSLYQQHLHNDLPVRLIGEFDPEIFFLLDNQPNNGRLGYRVFQVFYHGQAAVLVNLGWVQGSRDRSELPDIKPITGQFELTGHVRVIEPGITLADQVYQSKTWPLRVQQIEINKLSRLINKQLLPFAVFLDKKEQVGYQKNWQPVVMPPEKHRGYAFQWFSLAIAWLLLMIYAAAKHNKNKIG